MTVGGHAARVDAPAVAGGATGRIRLLELWAPAAGVAALSLAVMYVVSLAGLALVGVRAGTGTLLAAAAGSVALAVGGSVRPDATALLVDSHGAITVVPLTVAVAGAAALGVAFVRHCRRSRAREPRAVAGAASRIGVFFLGGLALVAYAGRHALPTSSIPTPNLDVPGLGNLSGLPVPDVGQSALAPSTGFHADVGATVGRGLMWLLVTLGITLLLVRRDVLRGRLALPRAVVRPVLLGLAVPVVGWLALSAVVILVEGLPGNTAQHLGLMLLGLPNVAWMLLLLGLGVPLQISASGTAQASLPHLVRSDLNVAGHDRHSLTLQDLAGLDHRLWLMPVAAAILVAAGGVTAARLRQRSTNVTDTALLAATLGVIAVALAVGTGISVNAQVSVADVVGGAAGLSVHARLVPTLLAGLAWGALAGAVGAVAYRWPSISRSTNV